MLEERLSVKFEIGFIHQERRPRRRTSDLKQTLARNRRSRWIIRICHCDQPRAGGDSRKQCFQRKGKVIAGRNLNQTRTFSLREDRIHGKSGHDNHRLVAGLEISRAQQMNRLIHPVREQNLSRIEFKKISHLTFHRLALWITCQGFRIQRVQPCQHARRTTDCALVKIKPQSLATGQRRPISMHSLYRGAGLKHYRHLTRNDSAWACKPSVSASTMAGGAMARIPARDTLWQAIMRT